MSLSTNVSDSIYFIWRRLGRRLLFFLDAIEETVQNFSFNSLGIALLWIRMRTGSASFCWIQIGIGTKGIPIRIGINARHRKKLINYTVLVPQNVNMLSKLLTNYEIFDTDEKDKTF
jgi:hypothetical protein